MRLVIDGYNVIGRIHSLRSYFPRDLERARKGLNELLRRFKKIKGHKITVVYDGPGGVWGREESSKSSGIKEIFTSERDQADDVIMRMARADPRVLVVVTGDGRVAGVCRKAGAAVMSPGELEDSIMQAVYDDQKGGDVQEKDVRAAANKKKGPSKRLTRKKRKEIRLKKKI